MAEFRTTVMWPSSCLCRGAMELIRGRKTQRWQETSAEKMYRFPATEEIWEVDCVEDEKVEQREVPAARKPRNLPIAS
jgi:hypothetical protein